MVPENLWSSPQVTTALLCGLIWYLATVSMTVWGPMSHLEEESAFFGRLTRLAKCEPSTDGEKVKQRNNADGIPFHGISARRPLEDPVDGHHKEDRGDNTALQWQ